MPLYKFECESCGKQFELLCSIADREARRAACPDCGSNDLRQRFGAVAIRVKSSEPDCPHGAACGGCCG